MTEPEKGTAAPSAPAPDANVVPPRAVPEAESPVLAVVIVTYHPGDELRECLDSVARELAGVHHEVWIIDNASGEAAGARVRAWAPSAHVVRLAENVGFGAANNVVFARSRAAHFLLLNPDAVLLPGCWTALHDSMVAHADAGAVAPAVIRADGAVQSSAWAFPTLLAEWRGIVRTSGSPADRRAVGARDTVAVDSCSGACLCVPRATIEAVGGFDERYFMYSEEVDWCRRMWRSGRAVYYVPHARVLHTGQTSSSGEAQRWLIPEHYRGKRRYFLSYHGARAEAALRVIVLLAAAVRLLVIAGRRLTGRLDRPTFAVRAAGFLCTAREALAPLRTRNVVARELSLDDRVTPRNGGTS